MYVYYWLNFRNSTRREELRMGWNKFESRHLQEDFELRVNLPLFEAVTFTNSFHTSGKRGTA